MMEKGFSRQSEGCAWECMLVTTGCLRCFRYYTKRSGHLGRQVVRIVFAKINNRWVLRWANCLECVGGESRPWCTHITMGFPHLQDIKTGRTISGACTDGRRPWGPSTLDVDSRYHRTTLEFAILSGQAHMSFFTGLTIFPPMLAQPKVKSFLQKYKELNSSQSYMNDPDDLIVEQNFGSPHECSWIRKRRGEHVEYTRLRKRIHLQCKQDRDILNEFCKE